MEYDQNILDVFFPEQLQLSVSTRNWAEYKHAVETVCRLKGVDENLMANDACLFAHRKDFLQNEPDDWWVRDELCKAIITLNVKDFTRYGVPAGENVPARTVWARLVEMHKPRPKKGWSVRLREWLGPMPLTSVELALLMLWILTIFRLGKAETELKEARAECRTGPTVYTAGVASYDDLVRYYRGR